MRNGEVGMDPDRYCAHGCRRHAIVWWALISEDKPERDWFTCGPCSDTSADALIAQGWVRVADEAIAPTPGRHDQRRRQ